MVSSLSCALGGSEGRLGRRSLRIAPALLLALAAAAPSPAHAYPVKPPWRGDSLPQFTYLRTNGHGTGSSWCTPGFSCNMDIFAIRWDDAAGQYSRSRTTLTSSPSRNDDAGWGMPFYSPVDGEIIACLRSLPDDVAAGSEPAACPGTNNANTCVAGGNHVVIRIAQPGPLLNEHIITLAHLREDSIPEELCPIDDDIVFNTDPKNCTLAGWTGALRQSARLDLRGISPIPVRQGEFIGRMGLSGNTGSVHLHMGASEITTDSSGNTCEKEVEIEFDEAWSQPLVPGVEPTPLAWDRLDGDGPQIDGTEYLLFPDPLGPRTDEVAIEVGSLPALALTPAGGVAAYRNASGNLAAVGFEPDANSQLVFGMPAEEDAVSGVALSRINDTSPHAVAAVINSDDKLQLIPYYVDGAADVIRGIGRTESTAGVGQVEATRSPTHDGIVVAIKNSSNAISVINYGVTTTDIEELTVSRRGSDASSLAIADVDIATVVKGRGASQSSGAWKGVVTVERRSSDNTMWVRSWSIDSAGTTVTLIDTEQVTDATTSQALTVTDVDVTVTGAGSGREFAVVSGATAAGLRVQTWEISNTGQLARIDQWNAGVVTGISSARVGAQDAVVGVRSSSGTSLISFHVNSLGELGRGGTRDLANVASLALDGRSTEEDFVFMAPDGSSEVSLFHYLTNYSSSR
ncbi:hypothetical protein WMF37_47215 [Sorangium sp. So ce291]|uniref:hypothetical protein n=1 Tax=Sorangium sp. So ce291 TaxID=3133294 RepID=UPI003F61B8CD